VKGRSALAFALACLAASGQARADGEDPPAQQQAGRHRAGVVLRVEQPNHGLDAWRALRVEWASVPGNWQPDWHAAAVTEERFDTRDNGIELGTSLPLDERWMLQGDIGVAPGADFLPRQSAELRLVRRFSASGVLAGIGLRNARYRDQRVDRALASLERYAGNWRYAWTASLTRIDGRHAPGHELALDRYYADRDSIGLRLARGKESIALPDGSRSFGEVQSVALVGRHWLSPRWGLQWGAGTVVQSGLYDRAWLQFGLQRAW
jgi:YaiO family outer membrane protein